MTGVAALLIGVEESDLAPLPGCIDAVQRVAEWLRKQGVSEPRLRILTSPGDTAPTFANIQQAVQALKHETGETLFVFWAGHGALSDHRRVLYFADSGTLQLTLSLDSLLLELRTGPSDNFRRQFAFVDACAIDDAKLKAAYRFHAYEYRSAAEISDRRQYAFFASQRGQIAQYKNRLGEFSRELLDELCGKTLPLNVEALAANLHARFERRHATGGPAPSEYWYLGGRGEPIEWRDRFDLRTAVSADVAELEEDFVAQGLAGSDDALRVPTRPGSMQPVAGPLRRELARLDRSLVKVSPAAAPSPDARRPEVPIERFLAEHTRIALLGPPGSGKSTILRQLLHRFGQTWRDHPVGPEALADLPDGWRLRIPVLVSLNRWRDPAQGLLDFVKQQLRERHADDLAIRLKDLIEDGSVVLLLDGLNEIPALERDAASSEIRDARATSIRTFCEANRTLGCVLSCRVGDFAGGPQWRDLHLLALDRGQVHEFARVAFGDHEEAERLAERFVTELFDRKDARAQRLRDLAAWPFYLVKLLAHFYRNEGTGQPENHGAILHYTIEEGIHLAVERGQIPRDQRETLLARLACLAFNLTDDGRVVVERNLAAAWLFEPREEEFQDGSGGGTPSVTPERVAEAEATIRWAVAAGLLWTTERDVRFLHQIFQEYFCALFGTTRDLDESLLQRMTYPQFNEVWRFCRDLDSADRLVPRLTEHLRAELDTTRRDAATALGRFGDPRTIDPLVEALRDRRAFSVQAAAAGALGGIGDRRAVEPLVEALRDPRWSVQEAAAEALGRIGDRGAVEPLLAMLLDRGLDMDVRLRVIGALGLIRDPRAIEPIITELKSGDYELTLQSAKALASIGPAAAAPLVRELPGMGGLAREDGERALEWIRSERPAPSPEETAGPLARRSSRRTFMDRLRASRNDTPGD